MGSSEDQIGEIEDITTVVPPIPRELVDIQNMYAFSSVKHIYYAPKEHHTVTNRMPVDVALGNLKWLNADTFESVYYPNRRNQRYVDATSAALPPVRQTRSVSTPQIVSVERKQEIKPDDDDADKRRKLLKFKDWDTLASGTQISISSGRTPFDMTKLNPKRGESAEDGKYDKSALLQDRGGRASRPRARTCAS